MRVPFDETGQQRTAGKFYNSYVGSRLDVVVRPDSDDLIVVHKDRYAGYDFFAIENPVGLEEVCGLSKSGETKKEQYYW